MRNGELTDKIDAALAEVRPRWNEARAAALAGRLERRRQKRQLYARSLSALAVSCAVAGAMWLFIGIRPLPPAEVASAASIVMFPDGSYAQALDGAPPAFASRYEPSGRFVELSRGGRLRFAILHEPSRAFVLTTQAFAVQTMGAKFEIDTALGAAGVVVEEGTVEVREANASTWRRIAASAGPARDEAPAEERVGELRAVKSASPRNEWRRLARRARYEEAFEVLAKSELQALPDEPEVLLQAADVARLSHHPHHAVAPLRRLVSHHARDARAPLAAFTLGLVYLQQLNQPRAAALAFERALALAPEGVLAPDALARSAEAHAKAGARAAAADAARSYLQRHPQGAKAGAMKALAGGP